MNMEPKKDVAGLAAKNGAPLNLEQLEIETTRLILRPLTIDYAEIMFREFTPEITQYMFPSSPKEIGETEGFIRGTVALRKENLEIVCVILNRDDQAFLGVCGLHARKNPREPEFGIWLKKAAHGSGYGREAIHGLYDWAVRTLRIDSFIYPVDKANTPSRKIPESLGGTVFAEAIVSTQSGGTLDEVIYRIPVVEVIK